MPCPMPSYKKYDPRLESLVMETKTLWDESARDLSEEDRRFLAESLHRDPHLASRLEYVRSHTGFTRVITLGADDFERISRAHPTD